MFFLCLHHLFSSHGSVQPSLCCLDIQIPWNRNRIRATRCTSVRIMPAIVRLALLFQNRDYYSVWCLSTVLITVGIALPSSLFSIALSSLSFTITRAQLLPSQRSCRFDIHIRRTRGSAVRCIYDHNVRASLISLDIVSFIHDSSALGAPATVSHGICLLSSCSCQLKNLPFLCQLGLSPWIIDITTPGRLSFQVVLLSRLLPPWGYPEEF